MGTFPTSLSYFLLFNFDFLLFTITNDEEDASYNGQSTGVYRPADPFVFFFIYFNRADVDHFLFRLNAESAVYQHEDSSDDKDDAKCFHMSEFGKSNTNGRP